MLLISLILKIESESSQLGAQLLLYARSVTWYKCSRLQVKWWESFVSPQSTAESWREGVSSTVPEGSASLRQM